jgi:tetratricopeptide (TPR) repeat protein
MARILSGHCRVDIAVVTCLREALSTHWHLEETIGSTRVLPVILPGIELVEQLTRLARGRVRAALVTLVAEYHELAGRLSDHEGDQRVALYHYHRALDAAQEVDDANVIAGVYGLKSHVAWGGREAASTIALAETGQRDVHRLSAGVAGAVAQMQSRGHALQTERAVAERLIDRTEQLTAHACEHPEDEPWWAYAQTPERAMFQRGVIYLELGRFWEARDLLDEARARLPDAYHRDHGRWAASFAVATWRGQWLPGARR